MKASTTAGRRSRHAPPEHHRRRGGAPAHLERRRHYLDRPQRRDLQFRNRCASAWNPATFSARIPTPKPSSTSTRRTASISSTAARHVRLRVLGRKLERLIIARDRIGEKPLYYAATPPPALCFRAEDDSRGQRSRVASISTRSADIFALDYVPAPATIFEESTNCAPAISRRRERPVRDLEYWDVRLIAPKTVPKTNGSSKSANIAGIGPLAMVSDVPLGAFLSGGIDSSAIVAAMARASGLPREDLSIGFEDETRLQRAGIRAHRRRRFHTDITKLSSSRRRRS